jgi:hypothetical protein
LARVVAAYCFSIEPFSVVIASGGEAIQTKRRAQCQSLDGFALLAMTFAADR